MKNIFICLFLPAFIHAQKPLSVGDKLSAEIVESLVTNNKLKTTNHKLQTVNRLIILDFFATWCTGCVRELPKLDSLQKKFPGRFNVILVSEQPMEAINAFRKKNKVFASVSFPVLASDSIFRELFPHKYIPHEVWINEQGKILAITDPLRVNAENIQSFLAGKNLNLPVKVDALDFDRKKPLLQNNNGGTESNLLFRSMFTTYLQGMGKSEGRARTTGNTRFYFLNNGILYLYKAALDFELNRIILEIADTNRYIIPGQPSDEWKEKNLYCYELTLPASSSKETMQQFLLDDLNRYFSLFGRIEKRKMKCWALVRNNNDDSLLRTRSVKPRITVSDSTGNHIYMNQPVKKFVAGLNSQKSPSINKPVFLDETGILFNIDIELPDVAYTDLTILKSSLAAYRLALVEVEREIDMFILSEKTKPSNPNAKKF